MMEKEPFEDLETDKNNLRDFINEIQRLKEKEAREETSVHLRDLNPANLAEEDKEIYDKFLKVGDDNVDEFIREFERYRTALRDTNKIDSKLFAAYLGNKIMAKKYRHLLEEK